MDYNIKKDIDMICHLEGITTTELADKLDISRTVLYQWIEKGISNKKDLDLFYNYIYHSKHDLKKVKEQLYREELSAKNQILLFHGAKTDIQGEIRISKTKEDNDFGKGFYCGETLEQSSTFVSGYKDSNVYMLSFDPKGLKNETFKIDRKWMLTIAYYRKTIGDFSHAKYLDSLPIKEDVDYIIAPIADNRMFEIINNFIDGFITDKQCQYCLSATNLGMQYVFKSEKSLKQLKILEKCYLSPFEKEKYKKEKLEQSLINADKVKFALKEYRNQGKYVEELLK